MKLILEHGPNVDLMYGQGNGTGYRQPPRIPRRQMVDVADLAAASLVYRTWIDKAGLGSGNLTMASGNVLDGKKHVAHISYNGRVWTPDPYGHPDHKEIKV